MSNKAKFFKKGAEIIVIGKCVVKLNDFLAVKMIKIGLEHCDLKVSE